MQNSKARTAPRNPFADIWAGMTHMLQRLIAAESAAATNAARDQRIAALEARIAKLEGK